MTFRRRDITLRRAGTLPVLLAAALTLWPSAPAAAQSSSTGGAEARLDTLDVRPAALAKRTLRIAGDVGAENAGRTVRVERQRPDGSWSLVATAVAGDDGAFVTRWRTDAPGRYTLHATVAREADSANAAAAPSGLLARVAVFRPATASWYGPRFFGRTTACGVKLARRTIGVAHKRLPCGTRVEIYHRGRTIVAPVIDRGPFIAGRQWDLTQATAEAIGMQGIARIGVLRAP